MIRPVKTGERMDYPRNAGKGTRAANRVAGRTYTGETNDKDQLVFSFVVPEDGAVAVGGVLGADGSTGFERVTLRHLVLGLGRGMQNRQETVRQFERLPLS